MKKSDFSSLHTCYTFTTAFFKAAVLFCVTSCNLFYFKENYYTDFDWVVIQTELKIFQI